MKYKNLSNPEKWIIKGIPCLFAAGSALHFAYEISGKNTVIGLFAAINESVWEHTKMIVLPVVLWWIIYYVCKRKDYSIDPNKWSTSCLVSLLTGITVIPILFYFYTEAFGIEKVWIDIAILLVADMAGQFLALHFYKYSRGLNWIVASAMIILVIALYVIFTIFTPHIPLFRDLVSGGYGIL